MCINTKKALLKIRLAVPNTHTEREREKKHAFLQHPKRAEIEERKKEIVPIFFFSPLCCGTEKKSERH